MRAAEADIGVSARGFGEGDVVGGAMISPASASAGLSSVDARELTDRIRLGAEAVWELVKQAYVSRAWSVLGYDSWDDYCTREFGNTRLQVPREERSEVVASMREIGMSTRAIAAAVGVDHATVSRELSGGANATPVPVDRSRRQDLSAEIACTGNGLGLG